MTVDRREEVEYDQFPVGMRVLAVDDDPICLKLLESLLRKCSYHVTTTSQAIKALKLLRENKDKFDLVISDVHMPDMDGFKLLELVGLEMDLPVIMLSANGDTKLVMKGITHGACDYLLKPVRIEELKNIWQHVVRKKKKVHSKEENNLDQRYNENEGGQALSRTGDSDRNLKLNRKRKDQKEDDDEDRENENIEDLSTQKKARLVWTVDLHRKFVSAVRTLGVDKAVPKKILDMMNVENLTRENVASHLQKYRKYLNRISSVTSQQANMVAAFGGPEAAFLRMTSLNNYGSLPNTSVRPFSSIGLLGSGLNTPTGLPVQPPPSSGIISLGHTQSWNNPMDTQHSFQNVIIPGNQNGNILQGVPTSLEFDQLQLDKGGGNHSEPLSIASIKSPVFPISGPINQPCGTFSLSNMEFPGELPDFGRCTDSWSAGQPNPFMSSDSLQMSITTPVSSCTIPSGNGSSGLRADYTRILQGEGNDLSTYQNPNLVSDPMNSMILSHGVLDALPQYNESYDNKKIDYSGINDTDVVEIQSLGNPQIMQQTKIEQSALKTEVMMKHGYLLEQTNSLGGYSYNDGGSLEDLVSGMMKVDQDMFL